MEDRGGNLGTIHSRRLVPLSNTGERFWKDKELTPENKIGSSLGQDFCRSRHGRKRGFFVSRSTRAVAAEHCPVRLSGEHDLTLLCSFAVLVRRLGWHCTSYRLLYT